MSKMRKEYDPNKVKRRKRKPIVYIICEGKETETLYFKHFRSRNCLVDIIPIPSKHKAAEHLVKHAKSLISQADYYPKDGDQLWCVFDCDDNKDSELQAAISYSEKHGYKIAYSNPAFEYWYLLHFEKRNGYLKDSATVIDILKNKGYLENYGKSVDVFEELQEHQPEAIQYAKERVDNNKPGSGGNDKFEDYTDDVPADEKQLSVALQILRAAGFGKASTSMCLLMGLKQHAIKMDGLLILQ